LGLDRFACGEQAFIPARQCPAPARPGRQGVLIGALNVSTTFTGAVPSAAAAAAAVLPLKVLGKTQIFRQKKTRYI